MWTGTLPLQGVRVYEQSQTLAGRLAGLLLADQGAEVYAARPEHQDARLDDYLSRGKHFVPAAAVATCHPAGADLVPN
jgi:crotonobetainyl-CoA:carnitine CoA-transferase CaiB-like acyl-CoA transferase